jgi:hypothetical protein
MPPFSATRASLSPRFSPLFSHFIIAITSPRRCDRSAAVHLVESSPSKVENPRHSTLDCRAMFAMSEMNPLLKKKLIKHVFIGLDTDFL